MDTKLHNNYNMDKEFVAIRKNYISIEEYFFYVKNVV